MTLVLNMVRCPDAVSPQSRSVGGGELSIGRGSETDWPLMDPDRVLSKKHCVLEFYNGGWQVRDTSTNGTYLNRDADPIGKDRVRDLRDGDRLRFGSYELEVRIEDAGDGWAPAPAASSGARGSAAASSFGDDRMFGATPPDPYAPPAAGAGGFDDVAFGAADNVSMGRGNMLPDDLDFGLGAPEPVGHEAPASQFDHAPPGQQSFSVPRPAATPLPDEDDWLADLMPAKAPSPAPPPPQPLGQLGGPTPIAHAPPPAFAPMMPCRQAAPPPPAPPPMPPAVPPPMPPPMPPPADVVGSPFDEPDDFLDPPPPAPPAPPPRAPMAAAPLPVQVPVPVPVQMPADPGDLLAAFLRGAGLEDARPVDPLATMAALGEAFRAVVAGLRQALIARASIKGEFRIEQTMIRARGNNPLKFSAGDDDALAALLGVGRRVDLTPAAAIGDALRDMRLHELASMAAMQSAVRSFLARLDPAPIKAEAEKAGGLLPAQKRARAFDAFEKLHGDMTRALADDFDAVFGRAFARAYEQALAEASDKERSA